MMKGYAAPGEILFWILSQKGELLSNFNSWKIVSPCFNLCDYFVIDEKEGVQLDHSWFLQSEKPWIHIEICIQPASCNRQVMRY
jgi:hypothetical protein